MSSNEPYTLNGSHHEDPSSSSSVWASATPPPEREAAFKSAGNDDSRHQYDQALARVLADDGDEETVGKRILDNKPTGGSEEETFVYPGQEDGEDDSFAYPGVGDNDIADEDGDASSQSYTTKMKSILGSSEGEGEAVEDPETSREYQAEDDGRTQLAAHHNEPPDDDERFVYPSDEQDANEGANVTASELPDRTMDSISATPASKGFNWRRASSAADFSFASSATDWTLDGSHSRPRRPVEYPTLSRLRSGKPDWPQRSSPFGTIGGFLGLNAGADSSRASFTPSTHSRSTSFSGSIAGKRRRHAFPYGGNELPVPSESSETSVPSSLPMRGFGMEPKAGLHQHSQKVADRGLFRWSALRKAALYFQNEGRASGTRATMYSASGQPLPTDLGGQTVLAVAGGIVAVGTSQGYAAVFEFSQELKCVCGNEDSHREAGAVTSLAFSADHSFLAVGHARGHVFLYDLARPAAPSRRVPPVSRQDVSSGRKEGHLEGSAILHVAFVGARHTAVFTADDHGLAFYHSLGKILGVASNDTLRLLGRYPDPARSGPPSSSNQGSSRRKPAPVLSMAALPLGSVDHPSDAVHFVALVTPHKLVIAGLKPSARTWYRRSAPLREPAAPATTNHNGELAPDVSSPGALDNSGRLRAPPSSQETGSDHSSRCACAAWFPAIQTEEQSSSADRNGIVQPMLAFAFDKALFLLRMTTKDVSVAAPNGSGQQTRRDLEFTEQALWKEVDERIDALQWLSPDLILLLTPVHLKLFDRRVGKVTEEELLHPTLASLVQPAGTTLHSRVGHSFRSHHSTTFFLTKNQIIVGHLLSWADRILALVSAGEFLSAIELCTAYYQGTVAGSLIGLPEDRDKAKDNVASKLRELMSASARYVFSPDRLTDQTHITADGRGVDRTETFQKLVKACTEACLALGETEWLFNDLYDFYTESGIDTIFAEEVESFVLDGRLRQLPTPVVQRLLRSCQTADDLDLAERLIWHLDPLCLDLDQAISLCKEHSLFDALIHVYNFALQDFVAPFIILLELLKDLVADHTRLEDAEVKEEARANVYKMFSYLSVVLSGHSFPSQEPLEEKSAAEAQTSLLNFIFSGHCKVWPPGGGGQLVLSVDEGQEELTYPYVRLLLHFDAEALLDALDIGFEESFMDVEDDHPLSGQVNSVSRQSIIDVLLELISEDADQDEIKSTPRSHRLTYEDRVFMTIFVARNTPKYPQFIQLSEVTIDGLLRVLALSEETETREDRQLAAEYLLSGRRKSFHFTDEQLAMFEQAGFWRILRTAYRASGKWPQLVSILLSDSSLGSDLFPQLSDVLQTATSKRRTGRSELDSMVIEATPQLLDIDADLTARLIDRFHPHGHSEVLQILEPDEAKQLAYLRVFLERSDEATRALLTPQQSTQALSIAHLSSEAKETYVELKAEFEPYDLVHTLEQYDVSTFDLAHVIEIGRQKQAFDAVLWALDRQGRTRESFQALDEFVATTLLAHDHSSDHIHRGEDHISRLKMAARVAVRICKARCQPTSGQALDMPVEELWYSLLRSLVNLVHHVAGSRDSVDTPAEPLLAASRDIVDETLSAMLTSMSAETVSFPALFRRLVSSEPSDNQNSDSHPASRVRYFAEVRMIVEAMTNACKVRTDLLGIANQLFDGDTAARFGQLAKQRRRGWRPDVTPQGDTTVRVNGKANGEPTNARRASGSPFTPRASSTTASRPELQRKLSRGIDFLATPRSSPSRDSNATTANQRSSGSSRLMGTPKPMKLDKGKGKERTSDQSSTAAGLGEEPDYFGSTSSVDFNGGPMAMDDPSEMFMASPASNGYEGSPATPGRSRSRSAALQEENQEEHGLSEEPESDERRPVVVRLGLAPS